MSGLWSQQGLTKPGPPLLAHSLRLELVVVAIQFFFYVGLLRNAQLGIMAQTRYFDWFITTPLMLLSMSSYFLYKSGDLSKSLGEVLTKHRTSILRILVLNLGMLVSGYLGELGMIPRLSAFVIGTALFLFMFRIIWKDMGGKKSKMFLPIAIVWGLYGKAYMLPEVPKNLMYNVLDLTSKNAFGAFLTHELLKMKM
jgi:bacteriorhodopsin